MNRGQTTLDFAIGIGVFLIVVAFVFAFVPGALGVFEDTAREETAAADRIATQLGTSALGDPAEPYVLDQRCTTEFFDPSDATGGPSCEGFDQATDLTGGDTLADRVGVGSTRLNLRVELRADDDDADADPEILCEGPNGEIDESDDISCVTEYAIGGDAPETGSAVSATRLVKIGTIDAKLEVTVW